MRDWERVRSLWGRVFALGWPVAAEQVFRTLMRTTDMFITALISPAAVVAVGLADLYAQFPLRIGLGLGGGAIALSSQDTGGDAIETRNEAIAQALLLGFLAGIPFAIVGVFLGGPMIAILGPEPEVVRLGGIYLAIVLATAPARHVALIGARALQGTGDTRTPMVVNIAGNGINIVISAVLGLGLLGVRQFGVIGVGIGTAVGNVVTAVLMFGAIVAPWASAGLARPRDLTITRQLLVVGIPRMGEGFVVALTRFPFNAILLGFGTAVNAGYHIGRRVLQQVSAPLQRSCRTAASIIVGQDLGEGNHERARFDGWWVTAFGVLTVGSIGIGVFLTAELIVGLFGDDPETIRYATYFAQTFGLTAAAYVAFSGFSGALQGASETRTPFLGRLLGVVVFMLGFTYVVGEMLAYGHLAAYAGIALSYVTMMLVVLWSFSRGRWAKRATDMMAERGSAADD